MPARKISQEIPAFTSDRLLLLGEMVTPRAIELARYRVFGGKGGKDAKLVKGKDFTVPDDQATVKTALLLAHIMNPAQRFAVEEEALMRGMDADGVNPGKREGLLRPL